MYLNGVKWAPGMGSGNGVRAGMGGGNGVRLPHRPRKNRVIQNLSLGRKT